MQGIIFILVSSNVNAGTAGLVDLTLYTYNGTVTAASTSATRSCTRRARSSR